MFQALNFRWSLVAEALILLAVPIVLTVLFERLRAAEGRSTRRGGRTGHQGTGTSGHEGRKGGDPAKRGTAEDKNKPPGQTFSAASSPNRSREALAGKPVTGHYGEDLNVFREISADMADVNIREIRLGGIDIRVALLFVDGLTDKIAMDENILRPLLTTLHPFQKLEAALSPADLKLIVTERVLQVAEVADAARMGDVLEKVLFGSTVLLLDSLPEAIVLGTARGQKRGVEEPISEALLRGPRVGFTETLSDNTALLRRHGQTTELAMRSYTVGRRIKKEMMLIYMRDVADPELIQEIERRIGTIDIDDAQESGYVEQLIEDNFLSPFQQLQNTERPDRVMAALLEGRACILLDGTPFALLAPVTFGMLLQSPEDYFERWIPGTLLRLLRFIAATASLFVPALYISFLSFHPGLIPTKLVMSIASSRQGVPFPTLVEALIMEFAIEILREAGLRLPKPIGPAMGIVGGLIIGQAAVEAGIVSPILVIVVAVTAISSFAIPMYSAGITLRALRFIAMFFAAVLGLYGVILFFLLLISHVMKLKSFGVQFAGFSVPGELKDLKDFAIRFPLQLMKHRPTMMKPKTRIRKGGGKPEGGGSS
ncbi:spore germination protein [Paenibacillus sp. CN-4]|uniref:spore germination protein n=1 Tax=Paenibacillus nanchangensis TaxID=3348343 RepID=UPI00397D6573